MYKASVRTCTRAPQAHMPWADGLVICPGLAGGLPLGGVSTPACVAPNATTLNPALANWWAAEWHHQPLAPSSRPFRCACHANSTQVFCSKSAHAEELFLLTLARLLGVSNGVFLEIGGNDGWSTSNSVYLEHCAGWRGVLIEPEPRTFAQLRWHRPRSLSVRTAACASHTSAQLLRRSDGQTTGSQVMEQVVQSSRPTIASFRPLRWIYNQSLVSGVAVPCAPLADLFQLLSLRRIDVLFVDVEGAEYLVLSTIDWRAVSVGIVSVEVCSIMVLSTRGLMYSRPFMCTRLNTGPSMFTVCMRACLRVRLARMRLPCIAIFKVQSHLLPLTVYQGQPDQEPPSGRLTPERGLWPCCVHRRVACEHLRPHFPPAWALSIRLRAAAARGGCVAARQSRPQGTRCTAVQGGA